MEDHAASSKASSSSPSSHRAEIEIKPKASLAPHARIESGQLFVHLKKLAQFWHRESLEAAHGHFPQLNHWRGWEAHLAISPAIPIPPLSSSVTNVARGGPGRYRRGNQATRMAADRPSISLFASRKTMATDVPLNESFIFSLPSRKAIRILVHFVKMHHTLIREEKIDLGTFELAVSDVPNAEFHSIHSRLKTLKATRSKHLNHEATLEAMLFFSPMKDTSTPLFAPVPPIRLGIEQTEYIAGQSAMGLLFIDVAAPLEIKDLRLVFKEHQESTSVEKELDVKRRTKEVVHSDRSILGAVHEIIDPASKLIPSGTYLFRFSQPLPVILPPTFDEICKRDFTSRDSIGVPAGKISYSLSVVSSFAASTEAEKPITHTHSAPITIKINPIPFTEILHDFEMKKELVKTVSLRHVDVSVKLDKKAYAPGETAFVKIVPLYNFWQRFLKTHICREMVENTCKEDVLKFEMDFVSIVAFEGKNTLVDMDAYKVFSSPKDFPMKLGAKKIFKTEYQIPDNTLGSFEHSESLSAVKIVSMFRFNFAIKGDDGLKDRFLVTFDIIPSYTKEELAKYGLAKLPELNLNITDSINDNPLLDRVDKFSLIPRFLDANGEVNGHIKLVKVLGTVPRSPLVAKAFSRKSAPSSYPTSAEKKEKEKTDKENEKEKEKEKDNKLKEKASDRHKRRRVSDRGSSSGSREKDKEKVPDHVTAKEKDKSKDGSVSTSSFKELKRSNSSDHLKKSKEGEDKESHAQKKSQ